MAGLRACIFGAGAVGLDLGVELIERGLDVAFVARGATLDALTSVGLESREGGGRRTIGPDRFRCAADPGALGEQDLVFLTIKSGALDEVTPQLTPLLGTETMVVTAHNGLPPWLSSGRPAIERHLPDTRARERFFAVVGRRRCIGAVVNRNASCPRPGIVERIAGTGMLLGELDGRRSDRLRALEHHVRGPRYSLRVSTDIHRELWHKLLINATLNPVSVLCERALDEMVDDPGIRARLRALIDELHGLGLALELVRPHSFDVDGLFERFATQRRGAHTSMLRDYWRGRALELDRIVRVSLWLAARPSLAYPMPRLSRLLREVEAKAGALATTTASASAWL